MGGREGRCAAGWSHAAPDTKAAAVDASGGLEKKAVMVPAIGLLWLNSSTVLVSGEDACC